MLSSAFGGQLEPGQPEGGQRVEGGQAGVGQVWQRDKRTAGQQPPQWRPQQLLLWLLLLRLLAPMGSMAGRLGFMMMGVVMGMMMVVVVVSPRGVCRGRGGGCSNQDDYLQKPSLTNSDVSFTSIVYVQIKKRKNKHFMLGPCLGMKS